MYKKILSCIICVSLLLTLSAFKTEAYATVIGEDISYNLPIIREMESKAEADYVAQQLSTVGNAGLSQDRVSGNYSLMVQADSNNDFLEFVLSWPRLISSI